MVLKHHVISLGDNSLVVDLMTTRDELAAEACAVQYYALSNMSG